MRNMGISERRFRRALTLFTLAEGWFAPEPFKTAFFLAAAFLALTAWARFCPFWWLGGIDTREVNSIEVLRRYVNRPK
jgi:hypothetical protein